MVTVAMMAGLRVGDLSGIEYGDVDGVECDGGYRLNSSRCQIGFWYEEVPLLLLFVQEPMEWRDNSSYPTFL